MAGNYLNTGAHFIAPRYFIHVLLYTTKPHLQVGFTGPLKPFR